MTSPSPLPPVRRVVTGHNASGQSIVALDSTLEGYPAVPGSETYFADAFWADKAPYDSNAAIANRPEGASMIAPSGSCLLVVDTPPGGKAPLHRTVTLDYGVVISGSITLVLENNKRVPLRAGDIYVQRGTLHSWENEGTEWARMYCVLLPAEKVKVGDKVLEMEFKPESA